MKTATKPEFKGTPLLEKPSVVHTADFVTGSYGEHVFSQCKEFAARKYGNANPLSVTKYEDGVMTGSNPFVCVLANEVLREDGLWTATLADSARIVRTNPEHLPIRDRHYVDPTLVLRTKGDSYNPNNLLAKNLARQVKARGFKLPVMVNLRDLDLEPSGDSPYGLLFKLRDGAQLIHDKRLNTAGRFDEQDELGLPIFNQDGKRGFYVRE
ncbi:hypothetical protein HYT58_02005, partial [Candidatus Woesearchaeota archaeon]|nr:hypothetical protein [Candidatus Woesearchaeota archaeon]